MTDLRQLGPDDWETVRAVRLRSLADSPESFGSTHARESAYDEARWRGLLSGGGWFVATDGTDSVGLVCGYHDESSPPEQRHLVAMWVAPQARGTGLADRLIDAVIAWARADGAAEVTLGVADGNERARAVYLRYGFVTTDQTLPLHSDLSRCIAIYRFGLDRTPLD